MGPWGPWFLKGRWHLSYPLYRLDPWYLWGRWYRFHLWDRLGLSCRFHPLDLWYPSCLLDPWYLKGPWDLSCPFRPLDPWCLSSRFHRLGQ